MNQIQAFIYNFDKDYFSGYTAKDDEKTTSRLKAYIHILDSTVRLTNECFYLVDFYKGSIPYMSYNPLYLCGLEPEIIKNQIDFSFNTYFATPQDIERTSKLTEEWLLFIMQKKISERIEYCLGIDYHLNKKLISLSMTPVILTPNGYPIVILCKVNLSRRLEAGETVILKNNCRNYWIYKNNQWMEKEHAKLNDMELQVLLLSVQGKTENEICRSIYRSKDGLKTIKRKLFQKMEVKTITEAVFNAIHYGLIR